MHQTWRRREVAVVKRLKTGCKDNANKKLSLLCTICQCAAVVHLQPIFGRQDMSTIFFVHKCEINSKTTGCLTDLYGVSRLGFALCTVSWTEKLRIEACKRGACDGKHQNHQQWGGLHSTTFYFS
jgi:hypothetical protein